MGKGAQSVYLFGSVLETMKAYCLASSFAFGILLFLSCYVTHALFYYVGGILFLASAIAPTLCRWRLKKRISVDGKAVFISGCDRGFGYMLAQRLDDIGFHVFAGCLFPEAPGAESLRKSGSKRLHVIGLDVTNDSSIQKALTYVEENLGNNALWAVVNNAGIASMGEISWISTESIQRTVDVNTLGAVRLTKAFLLKLKESQGRVVTVASLAGRWTFPHMVPYSMSKAAVIAFSDGLRLEVCKWNIQVITIEPTFYRTPLCSKEEIEKNSRLLWTNAAKNMKDACGSEYVEEKLQNLYRLVKYFLRNPIEVVLVLEEALTALYPELSYSPGSPIMRFCYWLSQRLPKPVTDMMMYVTEKCLNE